MIRAAVSDLLCEKSIRFEFALALTNVRSLPEDGIMDRMCAVHKRSHETAARE
jgi:hypothetical protein